MTRRSALTALAVMVGLVLSCSDEPKRPAAAINDTPTSIPPVSGGGSRQDAGKEAGADAEVDSGAPCNDLALQGPVVDRVGVIGEPPASTGGLIADGVYDLSDYEVFVGVGGVGGPSGITAQSSLAIAVDRIQQRVVFTPSAGAPTDSRTTLSFSTTATQILLNQLCPARGGSRQQQYTATDTTLTLTDPTTKEAFTFRKR